MSAIGSASARGPEMWSDMTSPRLVSGDQVSVRSLVEQGPQSRMLQRIGCIRIIEHPLKCRVDPLCLSDFLHRPAIVARIRRGGFLGAKDKTPERRHIRQTLIPVRVSERRVE